MDNAETMVLRANHKLNLPRLVARSELETMREDKRELALRRIIINVDEATDDMEDWRKTLAILERIKKIAKQAL